jgi:hypothetical protein
MYLSAFPLFVAQALIIFEYRTHRDLRLYILALAMFGGVFFVLTRALIASTRHKILVLRNIVLEDPRKRNNNLIGSLTPEGLYTLCYTELRHRSHTKRGLKPSTVSDASAAEVSWEQNFP